jgi:hypothetical protein
LVNIIIDREIPGPYPEKSLRPGKNRFSLRKIVPGRDETIPGREKSFINREKSLLDREK